MGAEIARAIRELSRVMMLILRMELIKGSAPTTTDRQIELKRLLNKIEK